MKAVHSIEGFIEKVGFELGVHERVKDDESGNDDKRWVDKWMRR